MHLDWECRVRFTVHYGASLVLSVDAHGKIFIAEDTGRQDFLRLSDSRCGSESWKQKTQVPARVFQDGLPPRLSLLPTLAMIEASLMVRSACSLPHMPQLHVEAGVAQRCGSIWFELFSLSLLAAGYVQMGVGGRTLLVRSASGEILAGAAGVQCLVRWPLDLLGNVRFGLQHRYRKLQGLGPVHPTIPAHGLLLSWRALLLIYWGT